MAPTYMDGLHTMAWLSLVGGVFLVLVAFTLGFLWIGEHFPKGRIARFLFGPQLTVRVSNWRSEDEQKDQRIQAAFHGVPSPKPLDRANLAASHSATVTPIAAGRRR